MINIRPARIEDAAGAAQVSDKSWEATYVNEKLGITKEILRARYKGKEEERAEKFRQAILSLKESKREMWVAIDEGKVVGFVWPGTINERSRVGALYILPGYVGKGIGGELLQKAIDFHKGKDLYVECASYNTTAEHFYTKHGFSRTGEEGTVSTNGVEIPVFWMVRKAH